MRRHAKVATAGSNLRQASRLGRIFRGGDVTRAASLTVDGSSARSRGRLVLCMPLALFLAALFAVPAQAAPETIAELGSNAGQVDLPVGTAVHQASGDLYVADRNNSRIVKFDSNGDFLLAWGFGVRDGETAELQTCGPQATPPQNWCFSSSRFFSSTGAGNVAAASVAVDQVSGDVYVVDTNRRRVTKFTSSGEFVFLVGKNVNKTKVDLGGGATQAEKNICTAASGDTCTSGASGTGEDNEFASPRSLAITPTGTVWVGDTNRLKPFDENGVPGAKIALESGSNTMSLAIDSAGDFYVRRASLPGIRKHAGPSAPVPGELLETLDEAGQARTVTLDAADNVYVGDETSPYRFLKYNTAGEQTAQFGADEVIGTPGDNSQNGNNAISVGEGAGKLYVASSNSGANSAVQAFPLPEPGPLVVGQGVEDIEPTTATLTATINSEGEETTYRFEYGTTEAYGQSTPTETLAAEDFESEDVEAGLEELIPDTTYHFRVVATNHCNPAEPAEECIAAGEDQTFTTLPAVVIDPQWVTDVTATTAELHAEMDPLGVEAEAWIEYGTTESYGTVVPLANLGEGFGPVLREHFLTDLQPGTTYHYRFVARDERDATTYTVNGPDCAFTTELSGLGFQLADDRAWEMVSPPDKHGAQLIGGGYDHLQASVDGEGIAYQSYLSTETDPEGNRVVEPSMSLARRDGAGSWRSEDIIPPNDRAAGTPIGSGSEYKLLNSDLSEALLEPRSGTPLSPEASERTPYLRQNTTPPAYTPLVTGKEPFANVPPSIEFGGTAAVGNVKLAGASPDFRHFALTSGSGVPLVEGAIVSGRTAYEWTDGQIKPVSVLPPGEGGALAGEATIGSGIGSVRGAVSEDGTRVFWSRESAGDLAALYVRDTQAEESARLDLKRPDASGFGTARPVFQGASADGSVVFFTDSQQLTEDSSPKGSDLYRCELPPGSAGSGCATLTDISVPTGAGESAEVEGIAAGIAGDGQTIYFVARGVLDQAPSQLGDSAIPGEPNLYLWRQDAGVRFVATLADGDELDWGGGGGGNGGMLSAAASPSGRYLAFMSQRSLTGYQNGDASTGEPAQEVFVYDALGDRVECVSCNPTGANPHGAIGLGKEEGLISPTGLWDGQRLAATLPEADTVSLNGISLYRPRAVLDNGRAFFNAVDSLVPADSNGQWDVYQYEPTGVGDCFPSSGGASVSRSAGGCVSLISSGTADKEAAFFDASETGDDAFFFTPAQLSVLDQDHEVDIYDARVNGIPATLPQINECLGEACQPAAEVPNDPTPASAAFKGAGNLALSPNCGAISRRTGKLARRAKALRRKANRGGSPKAKKQLRRKAKRHARKARGLSKRAKRCRRANRGAGR